MQITNTQQEDLADIFAIYDDAIAYQKEAGNNHWLGFEEALLLKEIEELRHYKITDDGRIVATFVITLSDPAIWQDLNRAAVYIHRIAIRKDFRGNNVLGAIITWARTYAKENSLPLIRLDTGTGNDRLINYYKKCGFNYLGDTTIAYTPDLPAHFKDGHFALLEMTV